MGVLRRPGGLGRALVLLSKLGLVGRLGGFQDVYVGRDLFGVDVSGAGVLGLGEGLLRLGMMWVRGVGGREDWEGNMPGGMEWLALLCLPLILPPGSHLFPVPLHP